MAEAEIAALVTRNLSWQQDGFIFSVCQSELLKILILLIGEGIQWSSPDIPMHRALKAIGHVVVLQRLKPRLS